MIQLIRWLREIEQLARDTYLKSADYFQNDEPLSQFLHRIAEDEAQHCHVMAKALALAEKQFCGSRELIPAVTIDHETDKKIKSDFQEISDMLIAHKLTKEFLFKKILSMESSEWNDLFLYVVNTIKEEKPEFKYAATKIQQHKRFIEHFLEKIPIATDDVKNLKALPVVWEENILIIEDDENISQLIQAILNDEGNIDVAPNGKEGLQKIKDKYYRLIISDIDMPEMDGISCFKQAVEAFPTINERYLFFTANASPEVAFFFETQNIDHLYKPSHISTIRDHALQILLKHEKITSL